MTDISNWPDTVHLMKVRARNPWNGQLEDHLIERTMVPLNAYQMGNLIDAIAQVQCNGDWYHEFISIVIVAMGLMGLKELQSNRGITYTLEQLKSGNLVGDGA